MERLEKFTENNIADPKYQFFPQKRNERQVHQTGIDDRRVERDTKVVPGC